MKYMLIMQGTQRDCATMTTLSPAELQAHFAFMVELFQELQRSGELVLAEGLDFPHHAKIVLPRA